MRRIIIAAAIILSPVAASAAESLTFEAVWSKGSGSNLVTGPQSHSEFLATGASLTERGLRLVDVETAIINGNRVYSGVWAPGTGANLFIGPMGPIDMRNELIARRQQNLRLADFEIFRQNGGRRYIGVWAPGTGNEILTGPMQEAAFLARGQRLTEDEGMRLIDVEIERVSGVTLYTGLFRSGVGSNFITTPVPRGNFIEIRDQMVSNGLELVDFERVEVGSQTRYAGVWSSGDGESSLSVPRDFAAFVAFGEELTADGFRTRDMELAVVGRPDPNGSDPPNGSQDPPRDVPTTADLPHEPPQGVALVSGNILSIDFTLIDDNVTLEIPSAHLPEWLPSHEGEVVLPETFCGFNLRRAGRFFWQIPGDDEVDEFPFNSVADVEGELGDEAYLGGIEFTGPIGGCAGTQTPWSFDAPFTQGGIPFEPLPNMRLVVQFDPGGEIRFREHEAPEGEIMDAADLFSDDTFAALEAIMESFGEFGEDNGYCEGVQGYMVEVCDQTPGLCPANPEEGPPVC